MFEANSTSPLADRPVRVRPDRSAKGHISVAQLEEVLTKAQETIAPLWPLKDYVAVNPFVGLTDSSFLAARENLRQLRDGDILMPLDYYHQQVVDGAIGREDIELALRQCRGEYPLWFADFTADALLEQVRQSRQQLAPTETERAFWTVAEAIDRQQETTWSSSITNEVSRHCAAHYDEGQAIWPNPWRGLPLYEAWREAAMVDRRLEKLGAPGFRKFVAELPATPQEAIASLLARLEIPAAHLTNFVVCQLYTVAGWASYVKYRVREAALAGRTDEDLIGLAAIRLAYDVGLVSAGLAPESLELFPGHHEAAQQCSVPNNETRARYALQVAAEIAFRRKLCATLVRGGNDAGRPKGARKVQMVFCIDVRSEVIRRHLESVSDEIETFGFAGFFGLAMEYLPLGSSSGPSQCPVLLTPGIRVTERLRGAEPQQQVAAIDERRQLRARRQVWRSFQSSAASCFSFVESTGLLYLPKLVLDSLRLSSPVSSSRFDGVPAKDRDRLGPDLACRTADEPGLERQIELAAGILRNLGLTGGFAKIVAICGHACETVNNPYRAGLDCGACGGHSGESNARVAASLLNQTAVRTGLQERGIEIPNDVWFVPALHNTTTDELSFFDLDTMPNSHAEDFEDLRHWAAEAGERTRAERARRMEGAPAADLLARSREWSEVRPEWGLAGNAAFVVAPRARTSAGSLDSRVFLHSYDHRLDPERNVLELIMTAPMIVTNWINLQYYASTVDNGHYGSGNKVLHNVVGQFGVFEGNGGDLMTGLPWQSVHDGHRYQHEPLRLLVVIEAPREAIAAIIEKHQMVRDLIGNGWLSLMAIDDEQFYQFTAHQGWIAWEQSRAEARNA